MTLRLCPDLEPADWITSRTVPWGQLVCFGPAGFPAYARLRFIPDPTHPGQSENEVEVEGKQDDNDQLALLFDLLASGTSTPEDCYFCLWDGWGILHGSPAVTVGIAGDSAQVEAAPSVAPAFGPEAMDGPKVVVPNRAYFLFRGPLSEAFEWNATDMWPKQPRVGMPSPAFAWPADRAWCVANDVDPHWAGIGADPSVITRLVSDHRLDIVTADPHAKQPAYR